MTNQQAFYPCGDTVVMAAATAAPTGIQAPTNTVNDKRSVGTYRIVNTGSVMVYLSVGPTAAKCASGAVIPTAGNSKRIIPMSAGSTEILRLGDDPFFSGITSAGTSTLFITPGKGL